MIVLPTDPTAAERPLPTKTVIAARLRMMADDMDYLAACMDYYGGFAEWSKHGREMAGAGQSHGNGQRKLRLLTLT